MDAPREHGLLVTALEAADALTDLSESDVDPGVGREWEVPGESFALRSLPEASPAREVASERNGQMIGRADECRDVGCNAFHRSEQHVPVRCVERGPGGPNDVGDMPALELVPQRRARVANVDR